jgi:pseudouridine-5'-phosphate glycosidase
LKNLLRIRDEIRDALATGQPVVALESTVIAHGLPRPRNLETALAMEAAVRREGAFPATIAVIAGEPVVGLSLEELEILATSNEVIKVSRRDFAPAISLKKTGATTVAGSLIVAAKAGIRVFATGGIGGAHRGVEQTFDISADLFELSRAPLAVVCAGAKSILDLPRTLEMLETLGVPLVGWQTWEFPAFYSRTSGLRLEYRAENAKEAAAIFRAQRDLGISSAVVFCNPPPEETALSSAELESLIVLGLRSAVTKKISGKALTPFLLAELARTSAGRTLEANIALLLNNATVAARIAAEINR